MLTYASVIYILLVFNILQAANKPTSCADNKNNTLKQQPNVEDVSLGSSLVTIIDRVSNILKELNVFTENTPTNNGNNTSPLPDIPMKKLQQPLQMIERLTDFINEKLQAVLTHLNNTLINNSAAIDNFSLQLKTELRQVPETELISDSCQRVDALVEQSFAQLKDCCNVNIRLMSSLCRSARQLISKGMSAFVDALDRVQTCLEDKSSYDDYLRPCMSVVYDDVSDLLRRANELRQKVNVVFPDCFLKSRKCLTVALVEIQQNQRDLGNELRENEHN